MPRPSVIFLALSVAANAALGVALWPHLSSSPGSTHPPNRHASTPSAATDRTDTAHWREISDTSDDAAFMQRLRAEGFPPGIVRALASNRVYQRFKHRFDALEKKSAPPKPYWQDSGWRSSHDIDPAIRAEQRALWREMDDAIRALLGPDYERHSAYRREHLAHSYGQLPSEKTSEIEAISRDYDEITQSIHENSRGVLLASDRQKLAYLEKEKRADITRLLSPEELEEYDRRNSPSAEDTRDTLRFVDSTEDHFLAIFALRRQFDERYGRDNLSGEEKDRRKAALPELDRQIEAALGPERYAEYQIVNDVNFSNTRATLDRIGLPQEKASDLVRIQRDAKKRAELIRNDRSLTITQRDEQLASLQNEATGKASAVLGTAENLDMFKRTAGQWLGKLVSRTNPDPK
jgi:hypothetical protein